MDQVIEAVETVRTRTGRVARAAPEMTTMEVRRAVEIVRTRVEMETKRKTPMGIAGSWSVLVLELNIVMV